jgi:hypothetical protein
MVETAGYTVQGKSATQPEYYVALALQKLKIPFEFQMAIGAGRRIAGGRILDFLAYTVPNPTAIPVYGEYWHRGSERTSDKLAIILIKEQFKNAVNILEVWEDHIPTIDDAYRLIKKELLY